MKILITGNLGYVGSVLVPYLAKHLSGVELIGLDTGFFAQVVSPADPIPERFLSRQIFRDLRNVSEKDLDGIDAIVHLGAISNDPIGNRFESVTNEVNFVASELLIKTALKVGIRRFVFASSCSMYGASDGPPKTESDSLNPLTAYARSKVAVEGVLRATCTSESTVTALRFATACGYSPRLRLDLVLNDLVMGGISKGEVKVQSDGTPWRPLIDVEDMARAIHWSLIRSKAEGGEYLAVNVGADEANYQVIDLAKAVVKAFPHARLLIKPDGQPDKRSYKVDFKLFKSLAPNYAPQVSLQDSILRLRTGIEKWDGLHTLNDTCHAVRLVKLEMGIVNQEISQSIGWIL